MDAQHRGRDLRLQLGCERRLEHLGLERRVADRLGAERVEPRRQVAVRAMRLHQRHRGRDGGEHRVVDDGRLGGRGRRLDGRDRRAVTVAVLLAQRLEQPGQAGMLRDQLAVAALEERPPLGGHRLGVLEVLLEDAPRVA